MAKKTKKRQYATEGVLEKLNNTAQDVEGFFEKNAKVLGIGFAALVLIALGYFGYLKYYVEPRSEEAFKEMHQADTYFAQDSINLALHGSAGNYQGYQQIIDNYGGTDAANLAKFKAGVSYYKLADYISAVKYLEDFSTKDAVMTVQKNGMIASALVQSSKLEEALPYYVKAAEGTDVEVLQSIYYTKAGQLAMQLGKEKEALGYFQILVDKYPNANNGEAEKYFERLKYATGGNGE